jgi:hypothetical protein
MMCANRKNVSFSTNDKVESLKSQGKGWQCNHQQNFFVEEQISVERKISLTEELVHGIQHRSFISEQQIMSVCKMQ